MYFQLIDPSTSGGQPQASIDCVLFAGARSLAVRDFAREGLVFELTEGMSVRVLGAVDIWPQGGRYQFIVQTVDPVWTQGEQALNLRKLLENLTESGVLAENSTLRMKRVPLVVGLITAEGCAACRDFIETLRESGFPFIVHTAWAPMQGRETSKGVVAAFNKLLAIQGIDVVVLSRGGGSATDLNWFNDEAIARTISQLPWPVISGIGHETDTTLPDFAAHTRAKTPTQAASILVDMVADYLQDLDSLSDLLVRTAVPGLKRALDRLTGLEKQLANYTAAVLRKAEISLEAVCSRFRVAALLPALRISSHRLETLRHRLGAHLDHRFRSEELLLERLSGQIDRRNPRKMLALGWAIVRNEKGGLVDSVGAVSRSDVIDVTLKDGSLLAEVRNVRNKEDNDG